MIQFSNWKTLLNAGAIVLAWLIFGVLARQFFFGETGYKANQRLEQRITEMNEQIIMLETENERLRNEILYRQSELYLEELARTELRQVFPGETVILIPTATPTVTPGKSLID